MQIEVSVFFLRNTPFHFPDKRGTCCFLSFSGFFSKIILMPSRNIWGWHIRVSYTFQPCKSHHHQQQWQRGTWIMWNKLFLDSEISNAKGPRPLVFTPLLSLDWLCLPLSPVCWGWAASIPWVSSIPTSSGQSMSTMSSPAPPASSSIFSRPTSNPAPGPGGY